MSRYNRRPSPAIRIGTILLIAVLGTGILLFFRTGISLRGDILNSPGKALGTVCLDPGHGGADTGASNQDLVERDLNLRVALRVENILEADGYKVFMTRTNNDAYLTNNDRVTYCNATGSDLLVAIHQNYFTDSSTDYTTALFYNQNSIGLAASLANATALRLGNENDGISSFPDGELIRAKMPAALIEGLFISSDREYSLISEPGSFRLVDEATGIAQGIENYFKNHHQKPAQITVLNQSSPPE